ATEELLAVLWCDLLHRERVGLDEDFFDLGGHSLLAAELAYHLLQVFGVELDLPSFFAQPTVAALAASVRRAQGAERSTGAPPILPAPRTPPPPLSFAQQRLWFLDQLAPGHAASHIPAAARLAGALDMRLLRRSLGEIARRHESLRTTFGMDAGAP